MNRPELPGLGDDAAKEDKRDSSSNDNPLQWDHIGQWAEDCHTNRQESSVHCTE